MDMHLRISNACAKLNSIYLNYRICLGWKGFTRTIMRRYIGQQPRSKSGCRPTDKTGCQPQLLFSIGLHRILFVRAFEASFRTNVNDASKRKKKRLPSARTDSSASRRVLPCPAPPLRRAPPRLDPPAMCPSLEFNKCNRGVDIHIDFKNRTHQRRVEMNQRTTIRTARKGGVRQNGMSTFRFTQETSALILSRRKIRTCLCISRITNKLHSM